MSTSETPTGVNTNLQKQDLSNLDISNLTPLSPEVISRQATINIGTIGHVAHGKSTVVKAISGVQTVRFKNELERNITIKLERIPDSIIEKLLRSKQALREFELKEAKKLKERQLRYEKDGIIVKITNDTNKTELSQNALTADGSENRKERSVSASPSSGYCSCGTDNISLVANVGEFTTPNSKCIKRPRKSAAGDLQRSLQQLQQTYSPTESQKATTSKKPKKSSKNDKQEYDLERIVCMESRQTKPVFFVKWLNYPSSENTWEKFDTLSECAILESFLEQQYELYHATITTIISGLNDQIDRENLRIQDASKINVRELDDYEPLLLKIDLILLAQFRAGGSRALKEPEQISQRAINRIIMQPHYYKRKQQLKLLAEFEKYMNEIEHAAPVRVENFVDLDVIDPTFKYIKESFPGERVTIGNDPPIGCKCEDGCTPSSKCCARMATSLFAYDKLGRFRLKPGDAIYECNRKCACDIQCVNRVIQRGRNNKLRLFKTSNGCGWGVRTDEAIRKGEYVCEYVGEIVTSKEADLRGKQYDAIGRTYLFDLDYNVSQESMYTIDAAYYGNVSHFINHSCDPNLAVVPFWINNLDINMPSLAFFTLRPISAGEELTFDYTRDSPVDAYENLSTAEKVICRCGAVNCRKVLF